MLFPKMTASCEGLRYLPQTQSHKISMSPYRHRFCIVSAGTCRVHGQHSRGVWRLPGHCAWRWHLLMWLRIDSFQTSSWLRGWTYCWTTTKYTIYHWSSPRVQGQMTHSHTKTTVGKGRSVDLIFKEIGSSTSHDRPAGPWLRNIPLARRRRSKDLGKGDGMEQN
jgi:hypothetical protein